jgi:hypothetical protein
MTTPRVPFELVLRGAGVWRARWEKLTVEIGGTTEAPDAACLATLGDVVARWTEVRQTIAAYCRGLAPEHHVPLDPASVGGFAARSCGFHDELYYESLAVPDPGAPGRVEVTFYTGYPDGYATYEIVLDGGVPTALSAFAS